MTFHTIQHYGGTWSKDRGKTVIPKVLESHTPKHNLWVLDKIAVANFTFMIQNHLTFSKRHILSGRLAFTAHKYKFLPWPWISKNIGMEVVAERGNPPALTLPGHMSPLNSYKLILLLISSKLGKGTINSLHKEKTVPKILYLNLYIRYLHVDELKCLSLFPFQFCLVWEYRRAYRSARLS